MATEAQSIFITKKEKLICQSCKSQISKGELFVGKDEKSKGICFKCSPFKNYSLLKPGDAALTRRSKKHSTLCGVVYAWNQRRKRFERKGQYVEEKAIQIAIIECQSDKKNRAKKNEKAAIIRAEKDKIYISEFAKSIRIHYPNCPINREFQIASHACEKYSGRVGRTANAKQFDKVMLDLAVEAHIRHTKTNYDNEFGNGKRKKEIRIDVKFEINKIMSNWRMLTPLP